MVVLKVLLLIFLRVFANQGTAAAALVNFEYSTRLCLAFILALNSVECFKNIGVVAKEEVVSIYSANFSDIPPHRDPYYIKVYRCVIDSHSWQCVKGWPKPKFQREIKIVVPDLQNQTKFYKYIVYNHTSCRCQTQNPKDNFDLHKNMSSHEITKNEFLSEVSKNPFNLRSCERSYCNKLHPRFHVHSKRMEVTSDKLFIQFYQCLPGCNEQIDELSIPTFLSSGQTINEAIRNSTSCSPY
ncbi:uncharacterized protein LOC124454931 [Xenia sp. Carnegie-2017]|uniref:uncharacterized protein LOC124454931 n=1 Tax=Xenia sp. Carnegie-2017 TaxID=2897299 RepID=UPI001F039678|nr:uncharacterized protein LOC124454931 [Xenia sp. Carnegie-2017]